jgi:hypothetical protein
MFDSPLSFSHPRRRKSLLLLLSPFFSFSFLFDLD